MNKLSENLTKLLRDANISENELARRTGIAQQIINRMLSGKNKNPKISTLNPLSNYFNMSISQLIGDETSQSKTALKIQQTSWQEIPIINLKLLESQSLTDLLQQDNQKLLVDSKLSGNNMFATIMLGNSMEPKFPEGTTLIFDLNKVPSTGDFVLLKLVSNTVEIRQLFIKDSQRYKKAMNPMHADYNITLISDTVNYLGLVIQSRTNYIFN